MTPPIRFGGWWHALWIYPVALVGGVMLGVAVAVLIPAIAMERLPALIRGQEERGQAQCR